MVNKRHDMILHFTSPSTNGKKEGREAWPNAIDFYFVVIFHSPTFARKQSAVPPEII